MNKAMRGRELLCVAALASGWATLPASAHVNLANATVSATTSASSNLVTTGEMNSLSQPGGAGAFPNWLGYSDAGQTIRQSTALSTCDFSLFMNAKMVIANGFANARITPGADFVSGRADAESRIEIAFHVHGPHHFEIHSVDVNQLNAVGAAYLLSEEGEVFRFEGVHVHEIRGSLPEGDCTLVLVASTGSDGADSAALFELEFEIFEGSLCLADLNGDRVVDDLDFVEFVAAYITLVCPVMRDGRHEEGCPADFDGDGVVDDADFVLFVGAYDRLLCD